MQQPVNQGAKREMGGTGFKWGGRAPVPPPAGDDPVNVLHHSYEYFFSIHYRPTTRFTFYSILQQTPGFTAYLKK